MHASDYFCGFHPLNFGLFKYFEKELSSHTGYTGSRAQVGLYRPDIGQIRETLNRTSRVDAVRLQIEFTFTKGSEVRALVTL